jgi:thioesterase domain-containing protein
VSLAELLSDLENRGVELWAEGDRLCYRSPKGALTPPLLERLRASKGQVLELIRGGAAEAGPSPLVELQRGGSGTPLFWVHPIGGTVLCYGALSHQLGAKRPVYGLQSRGLEGKGEPASALSEMAESYLAAIRRIQPAGPYLLGGWSMGGVVAFEMARRLEALGENAALLLLMDVRWPPPLEPLPDVRERVQIFAENTRRAAGGDAIDLAAVAARGEDEQLAAFREQAIQAGLFPASFGLDDVRRLYRVFTANQEALLAYKPEPYGGSAVLFVAAGNLSAGRAPLLGDWPDLVRGLDVQVVPGDHYSLLRRPWVDELAFRIRTILSELP